MRIQTHRIAIIVLALMAALAGCETYKPPESTDTSAATIQIIDGSFMQRVYIVEIDGVPTSALPPAGMLKGPSVYKVNPGQRAFLVENSSMGSGWRATLTLDVEAGETYYLRTINKGYTFDAWFEKAGKLPASNSAPEVSTQSQDLGVPGGTLRVPAGLTSSDIKRGILEAAVREEWTVVRSDDQKIVLHRSQRLWNSTLTLVYSAEAIAVYSNTTKSGRPNFPGSWIETLGERISEVYSTILRAKNA
jgi:hypothetical protein